MDTIQVETLHKDLSFTGDLLIDSTFLLLPQTVPLQDGLIDLLKKWGFSTIQCDGNLSLGGDIDLSPNNGSEQELNEQNKEKIGDTLKKAIESSKTAKIGNSDQDRMKMVESVFNEYMNYIEGVFTYYATHKEIDQEELSETIQELVMFVKDHKRYILRINPNPKETKKNFLIIHSMRTTILAIAIAQQLHLPLSKIIELGVTCIIHEIGMLRIPPQLYMSDKRLTVGEKAQISKHTIFGYTIVKDLGFPLSIQLGVLEHHEKENGLGYPRKLTGDKISSNAKIIAVACSYEAISSPRGFREGRSTFDAMVELIQNKSHAYDNSVLKALLYTVSLYPIGTYVYLSNRKVAIVVDTNPDSPKYPVVQLLNEKEKDGSPLQITTNHNGIYIIRILSKNELNDILKVLSGKNSKEDEVESLELANEEFKIEKNQNPKNVAEPKINNKDDDIEPIYLENENKTTFEEKPKEKSTKLENQEPKINVNDTEDVDISFFS